MKGLITFCGLIMAAGVFVYGGSFTVTVLYDNTVHIEGTQSDWGFACLVEGDKGSLLFDTGTKPHILANNAKKLGVDLGSIRRVMISHAHADHFGGLGAVLRAAPKGLVVYVPPRMPARVLQEIAASGGRAVPVQDAVDLGGGMRSTGVMNGRIPEQGLILETGKRKVLITGCAHPGIVEMVRRARELTGAAMDAVIGGFHLARRSAEVVAGIIADFRSLGVRRAGPTHCSGEKAIAAFRKAYGEDFLPMGVGRIVKFE